MKQLIYSLNIVCILIGAKAQAETPPAYQNLICQGPEIRHIPRPVHLGESTSEQFSYAFRYIPGTDPNLPIVIFLPGGPGAASTYLGDVLQEGLQVPKDFGVVLTDPRGTGCNSAILETLNPDEHSTKTWASDVKAIIGSIHPRKYILMGHSYGSVLATVVASEIEREKNLPPPESVVLLGVLGHSFRRTGEQYEGFIANWEALKKNLSAETLTKLSADRPLGLSSKEWASFIYKGLLTGGGPAVSSFESLTYHLELLGKGNGEELATLKLAVKKASSKAPSQQFLEVYQPFWCREFGTFDNTDFTLQNGKLIGFQDPNFCAGISMDRPYDSADFPIRAPIFYIQGDADPAVVVEQGRYHFNAHPEANRFFILVPEAGHFASPALSDCRDAIWNSVANNGADLEKALRACRWNTRLEVEGPDTFSCSFRR